jgi:nucleoside 2-deoxyribosyltransferase
MIEKLYLAGPDVFAPDATARFEAMRAACRAAGFVPLTPVDNALPAHLSGAVLAAFIKQANVAMIQACEAVVAHIAAFRGPNMDPGTAWEIGYAEALGKPVVLWCGSDTLLAERTPGDGHTDADGWMIENFGLAENLMIGIDASGATQPVAADFATALRHVRGLIKS